MPRLLSRLHEARLYLVCDPPSEQFLDAALRGGVDIVQLRMKEASDEEIILKARWVGGACGRHDAVFILNDRPDLVEAAGADGVHLGQEDTAVAAARERLGKDRLIGLSTHSAEQVDAAGRQAVDYIGVGPVYETPTKPGRPAVGLELVRYAAQRATVPFFAIGGISSENAETVRQAGGARVAVVRAITHARDPRQAAVCLRAVLERQRSESAGRQQEAGVGAAQP